MHNATVGCINKCLLFSITEETILEILKQYESCYNKILYAKGLNDKKNIKNLQLNILCL